MAARNRRHLLHAIWAATLSVTPSLHGLPARQPHWNKRPPGRGTQRQHVKVDSFRVANAPDVID
jgi:hypothetical protein